MTSGQCYELTHCSLFYRESNGATEMGTLRKRGQERRFGPRKENKKRTREADGGDVNVKRQRLRE